MKILVVDDHALIRDALRGVLSMVCADAVIVEAADWRQALEQIESNGAIDLVLLDLNLPDQDGLAALGRLRSRYPAISVVVLSARDDRESVSRALEAGALGFIPKGERREVMLQALKLVLSGGMYIPPEILANRPRVSAPIPSAASTPSRRASAADLGLTERQGEVLALMMRGHSNKAICRALDLAEPTVKNHVTAILKALGASNRTEAVIAANAIGFGLHPDAQ